MSTAAIPMRHFTFEITWLINEDWDPRTVRISLPASDCATDEQRSDMIQYAAGGLAVFYGASADDMEGFEAVLVEETLD